MAAPERWFFTWHSSYDNDVFDERVEEVAQSFGVMTDDGEDTDDDAPAIVGLDADGDVDADDTDDGEASADTGENDVEGAEDEGDPWQSSEAATLTFPVPAAIARLHEVYAPTDAPPSDGPDDVVTVALEVLSDPGCGAVMSILKDSFDNARAPQLARAIATALAHALGGVCDEAEWTRRFDSDTDPPGDPPDEA